MRTVTDQELNDAHAFGAYLAACAGAAFLVGVIAAFFS